MKFLRILLFPFSILYGCITFVRNLLFDIGILKSYKFDLPIIAVGNLSVGGTGKTPQIEYLIRLLEEYYKIATLSRGYKRHSKGFIHADSTSTATLIGDEPFQFYQKFPNIQVAVDEDRKNGIENLLNQNEKPNVILLDDAFQHRKVKAGFYILLTAYSDLFCDDFILPTGNLRESRRGAKRANIIVVTKCPKELSKIEMDTIKQKLIPFLIARNDKMNSIFFTSIAYDENIYSSTQKRSLNSLQQDSKLIIAGIAKPQPFFDYLQNDNNEKFIYQDHHHFSETDILNIKRKANERIIITTEKDYVRLKEHFSAEQLFYLPIKTSFVEQGEIFDQIILNYVQNS